MSRCGCGNAPMPWTACEEPLKQQSRAHNVHSSSRELRPSPSSCVDSDKLFARNDRSPLSTCVRVCNRCCCVAMHPRAMLWFTWCEPQRGARKESGRTRRPDATDWLTETLAAFAARCSADKLLLSRSCNYWWRDCVAILAQIGLCWRRQNYINAGSLPTGARCGAASWSRFFGGAQLMRPQLNICLTFVFWLALILLIIFLLNIAGVALIFSAFIEQCSFLPSADTKQESLALFVSQKKELKDGCINMSIGIRLAPCKLRFCTKQDIFVCYI